MRYDILHSWLYNNIMDYPQDQTANHFYDSALSSSAHNSIGNLDVPSNQDFNSRFTLPSRNDINVERKPDLMLENNVLQEINKKVKRRPKDLYLQKRVKLKKKKNKGELIFYLICY